MGLTLPGIPKPTVLPLYPIIIGPWPTILQGLRLQVKPNPKKGGSRGDYSIKPSLNPVRSPKP